MKYCDKCGGPMSDGARFCSKCGARANEEIDENIILEDTYADSEAESGNDTENVKRNICIFFII